MTQPEQEIRNAIWWLRASYVAGAIADCLTSVLMLIPGRMGESEFRISMGLGASLMCGWTALLVWACLKPLERKGVLLLTIFPVICGLSATNIWAAVAGQISVQRLIPPAIVCMTLIILMGYSYWKATIVEQRAIREG